MDRINSANFDTIGGKRFFRDKNLGTNTAGTTLAALWFNGAQEEILTAIEEAGLVPSSADNTQLMQALRQLLGKGRQVFTASGTFTPGTRVTRVKVRVWGAGGGGGGGNTTGAGGGAAGGGYTEGLFTVTPGVGTTVTVGTGGTAGAVNGNGGNGGTSSFGALCSATGGLGGLGVSSGLATGQLTVGAGTGGSHNVSGGPGLGANGPLSGIYFSGFGGHAFCSPGGQFAISGTGVVGVQGVGPGAGASGGTLAQVGAAGRDGLVIVEW